MMKTTVYHGDNLLGEVELYPEKNTTTSMGMGRMMMDELVMKGIKISQFSLASERCPPLAVLHTIASDGFWFKMESKPQQFRETPPPLLDLHSTCFRENKTAIMALGEDELHLVAMSSKKIHLKTICFWGFKVAKGLYNSSLVMLNLRCLGIVFDLDETLIVANTLKSFEDRIEGVKRKLSSEVDPKRNAGMLAEIRRYQEDKSILRQYAESDQIIDNGKVIKVQSEIVPALSESHQSIVRPIIRLQEKNIILTRINPLIRDTSVLVRMRPAWEDLRNYLTARGRKRFEVYVCTLAERDYALEMWRLLDPDANLISTSELRDRIVCVKHGARKSLFNVFSNGSCHPRMALVIDDRVVVWDEKDQPRVHIVPPFVPYYAPEAEANNVIPVLCMARNVACNVRGGFFKEFDDSLLQQISEVSYEDDLKNILPPDVSSYLVLEDDPSALDGNKEQLHSDVMSDAEVERRLKEAIVASAVPFGAATSTTNIDPRLAGSLQFPVSTASVTIPQPAPASFLPFSANHLQATSLVRPLGRVSPIDRSLQGSPAREEGEVPESELDPDTRRRLLILQHGLDTREHPPNEPPFPVRPHVQAPVQAPVQVPVLIPGPGPCPGPRIQPRGSWFPAEDQMSAGHLSRERGQEYPLAADGVHFGKQRPPPPPPPPFQRKMESPIPSGRTFLPKPRFSREVPHREERWRTNHSLPNYQSFTGEDVPSQLLSSSSRDFGIESGRPSSSNKDSETESDPPSSRNRDFDASAGQGFPHSDSLAGALHDIAMKCITQVEFRPSLVAATELKFCIQVYFGGEKIGEGIGKTRRDAQHQAAVASLMNLAGIFLPSLLLLLSMGLESWQGEVPHGKGDRYVAHIKNDSSLRPRECNQLQVHENGFLSNSNSYENQPSLNDETPPSSSPTEPTRPEKSSLDGLKNFNGSVYAPKELCSSEGLGVDFRAQPVVSTSVHMDEAYAEAAKDALASLKPMVGPFMPKRPGSPRSTQSISKRLKADPRILPQAPSSRYPRNASPLGGTLVELARQSQVSSKNKYFRVAGN
ncbi:hypothetical protein Dimus_032767 [Dionaea muscipula]